MQQDHAETLALYTAREVESLAELRSEIKSARAILAAIDTWAQGDGPEPDHGQMMEAGAYVARRARELHNVRSALQAMGPPWAGVLEIKEDAFGHYSVRVALTGTTLSRSGFILEDTARRFADAVWPLHEWASVDRSNAGNLGRIDTLVSSIQVIHDELHAMEHRTRVRPVQQGVQRRSKSR